jgi:hypothetical protein
MELDWEVVEDVATSLGVGPHALKKWRWRRSVPHRWRIPIIKASDGRIPLDAFDEFDVDDPA